jgi:polyferredoxin
MERVGKSGLIHYTWGEHGESSHAATTWYRRLGIRDAKRVVALLVLAFYACGLFVTLSMRRSVLVELLPDRSALYRVDSSGVVYNRFRVKLANRGKSPEAVSLRTEALPGASILLAPNPVTLAAGEGREVRFEVAAPAFRGAAEVNHFRIVTEASRAGERQSFDETFLMPAPGGER